MKILIAEDDLTSRMFMKRYLSKYGTCDVAVNGIETIDLVMKSIDKNETYDLICIDVMMPKISGIKALKAIREMEKNLLTANSSPATIIMTSALNDKETVEEAYRLGCEAYVWKPIDIKEFNELLTEMKLI